jgi:hypothetical protein
MTKPTKQIEVPKFVKVQLAEAQKRWQLFEGEANKLLTKLNGAELTKRATEAGTDLKKRLDGLQNRVVEAAGVASQNQVKALSRELNKLSRKLDAMAAKKAKPEARV